ncbi:MAG: hypothetical protein KJ592_00735 [Nanoarchaeota archaeon]|nr:hypothetical protein [Nanoarchaeota archaeon]
MKAKTRDFDVSKDNRLEKDVAQRASDMPHEYRRDICTDCGNLIKFPQHKVVNGPYSHISGLSGRDADVSYVHGFGHAEHKKCDFVNNEQFYENLRASVEELDERWIKPSSQPLRIVKSLTYAFMDF